MAVTLLHGKSSSQYAPININRLLYCGMFIPLVFWATSLICGLVLGDYNHFSRMVSELGTLGTPSQFLFTLGLLTCSSLSVLFVLGLRTMCQHLKLNALPVWLILSYSFSIAGAGLFPLPLRLHGILGMPSILLVLSPLAALVLWQRGNSRTTLMVMASLGLVLMSLGFLAFVPSVFSSFPGLKQRFFHLGWSIWFMYLSVSFMRTMEGHRPGLSPMQT
jgi:hypothetical membrane protein